MADVWSASADIYKQNSEATRAKPIAAMLEHLNLLVPFREATGILGNRSGPGPCLKSLRHMREASPNHTLWSVRTGPTEMTEELKRTKAQALAEDPNSGWSRVDARILDTIDLNSIPDRSISHVMA